jgi:arylsulfatase A-like enzyme
MPFENKGRDYVFPHRLPADPDSAARRMSWYPWMDSLTLDLALDGVRHTGVGSGTGTDLLSISLSTTDAVGHSFGPDSRELHDQILRVDHWLGWFLDSLATLVPRDRMLLVLTADHGMTSTPEYVVAVKHRRAGRVWLGDLAARAGDRLRARYDVDFGVKFDFGLLYADLAALRARGVDTDSLADALAREARRREGVAKVYTPRSLRAAPPSDVEAMRWKRQLPDDFGWLVCAVPEPDWVWAHATTDAEHGSARLEDVEVPIVLLGPGIRPGRVTRVVRTVDIAPTLAALLGVRPTERLDGVPLPEALARH